MKEHTIIHIDEISSTNSYLKDLSRVNKIEEGTVARADFQTQGRGQRGNGWESEKNKNLLFSTILYPHFVKINEQFMISQVVSLAIKNTLDKYVENITVKWPNDIYWNDRKICGILIENDLEDDEISRSIIGIGLNINQTHFVSNAPNPVSLQQICGVEHNLKGILNEILDNLHQLYEQIKTDKKSVISLYKQSLYRAIGYHSFNDDRGDFKARIKDVTEEGLLILLTETNEERRYAFKEVRFI